MYQLLPQFQLGDIKGNFRQVLSARENEHRVLSTNRDKTFQKFLYLIVKKNSCYFLLI